VFYFSNKIEDSLHEELMEMGVQTASLDSPDTDLDMYATTSNELNLDVTTLLAYVSALTNGSANWVYKEPLLTEQAERERASPLKPLLEKIVVYKVTAGYVVFLYGPCSNHLEGKCFYSMFLS